MKSLTCESLFASARFLIKRNNSLVTIASYLGAFCEVCARGIIQLFLLPPVERATKLAARFCKRFTCRFRVHCMMYVNSICRFPRTFPTDFSLPSLSAPSSPPSLVFMRATCTRSCTRIPPPPPFPVYPAILVSPVSLFLPRAGHAEWPTATEMKLFAN